MCVWHSAERHLLRLESHPCGGSRTRIPLFPDEEGKTASKQTFIEAIRRVIAKTGTSLTRPGPEGQDTRRYHGHVLRISGAQMLSSSGVELALIQLLGRWTSTAVLRYTQDSALSRVPNIPQQVLSEEALAHSSSRCKSCSQSPRPRRANRPCNRGPQPPGLRPLQLRFAVCRQNLSR